jgi:hypothetical protein
MKKMVLFFFLIGLVSVSVFAQSSARVNDLLNQALSKSIRALNMAKTGDFDSTASTIQSLLQEIQDYGFQIENWANQGNSFSSDQAEKWAKIIANVNEITQRMVAWAQRQ